MRRGGPRASSRPQKRRPAVASSTLVRLFLYLLLPGIGALHRSGDMLSRREHSFQVSVCPLPLGGVFEKDTFANRDFRGSTVGESRRLLTLLQGVQASQQLLRRHTRQGLCC